MNYYCIGINNNYEIKSAGLKGFSENMKFHWKKDFFQFKDYLYSTACPEIAVGREILTTKSDIWSIGCVFFRLLAGSIFISAKNNLNALNRMIEILGT